MGDIVERLEANAEDYTGELQGEAAAEIRRLRAALKPFADCADELDGSEYVAREPDGEWAKFRLLTDDYRAARAALKGEK